MAGPPEGADSPPRRGRAARRLALLLLAGGVVLGARLIQRRAVAIDLQLGLGARASELRAVDLVFTDEREHVERELALSYPSGAPARDARQVRLHQGGYTVGVRLEYGAGPPRTFSRELRVDEPGRYELELGP
jgi:hypothetical protein